MLLFTHVELNVAHRLQDERLLLDLAPSRRLCLLRVRHAQDRAYREQEGRRRVQVGTADDVAAA